MACQIFRDSNNNIQAVMDAQGNPSTLFREALAYSENSEKALEIAQIPYTQTFREINGEFKNEPSLSTVLTFMNRNNIKDKRLSKEQVDGLRNNTLSLPENNLEEIYQAVKPLYQDGVFTINRTTLNQTGLYTQGEIQVILGDPQAQQKIKNTVDALKAEVSVNNRQETPELATYETPELLNTVDTTELVGVGKFKQLNPFIADKQLRQKVGGIKNREDFEKNLEGVDEAITDRYYSDPAYANNLFTAYSSMERMPVLRDDSEGGLSNTPENDIKTFTQQALVVGKSARNLINTIDLLQATPRDVWVNSGIEIEDLLLRAEDFATELGIDLINLSNQEYSYEEVQYFLSSVRNLAVQAELGNVVEEDIDYYSDSYNAIFKQGLTPQITAQKVSPNNVGKALVKVNTIKGEQELFDNNSLIKTVDEGVYQRINKQEDTEGLYDYVTSLVQFNPNIIDKRALFDSSYSKGKFSLQLATKPNNAAAVKEDLKRYVNQQSLSEQLTLYKIAFGHPLETKTIIKVATQPKVTKSYEYLTGEYISEFAQEYLQEKQNDSKLYQSVYSHFTFDQSRISLKDTDPYSKQEIDLFTPQNSELRQYAAISKNTDLNSVFTYEANPVDLGVFYANNPEQLEQKSIQHEFSEDGEYVATANLQDNYINIGNQIWSKARSYKNLTIYQRMQPKNNPYFNDYSAPQTVNTKVDVKQFEQLVGTLNNISEIEKLYSKKELERINEESSC